MWCATFCDNHGAKLFSAKSEIQKSVSGVCHVLGLPVGQQGQCLEE